MLPSPVTCVFILHQPGKAWGRAACQAPVGPEPSLTSLAAPALVAAWWGAARRGPWSRSGPQRSPVWLHPHPWEPGSSPGGARNHSGSYKPFKGKE